MKKQHQIVAFLREHRTATVVTAVVVVLLGLTAYTFWSMNTWGAYQTKYTSWHQALQSRTNAALGLPSSNSKERVQKITALEDVGRQINETKGELCSVNGVIAWQSFISTLKSRQEACRAMEDKVGAFGEELGGVLAYLADERALAKITDEIANDQKQKVTEAAFEAQINLWNTRLEAIKKLNTRPAFAKVKNAAIEKTQATKAAWQAVYNAHKAKNKSKYLEAQTTLAKAYEGFSSLAGEADKEFTTLGESLKSTYTNIF